MYIINMRKDQQLRMDFDESEIREVDFGFRHCMIAVLQLAGFTSLIAITLYGLNYYVF